MPKKLKGLTQEQAEQLAIAAVIKTLEDARTNKAALVRAAQLLDYVQKYHHLLPHHDEFETLLLEHVRFVEARRREGDFPAAKTIKRPVSKPKLQKSAIGDIRKSHRAKTRKVIHDAHYRSGGLHK